MNNARRKDIRSVIAQLGPFMEAETWEEYQAAGGELALADLASTVGNICDAEQEAMENLPDSLRDGEKGEAMQGAIDALQSAADDLDGIEPDESAFSPEDMNDALQTVIDSLDEASA